METVSEVIKKLSKEHIDNNGLILGQCLTAVGWVGGTIPEIIDHPNIIELSMADVAGGAIATGVALSGRRPIYVVRYQGFQWYNLPSIVNYAAKSLDLWGIPCPIFVRSIAMEGGIGPVAGSSLHSMAYRMPGIKVFAPMTPMEYKRVWSLFMNDNCPYYISEHRGSYKNTEEIENITHQSPDFIIIACSITRFEAVKAIKELPEYKINLINIVDFDAAKSCIFNTLSVYGFPKYGVIMMDDDYSAGFMSDIKPCIPRVKMMCLPKRTAGFAPHKDVLPVNSNEIIQYIRESS